MVSLSQPQPMIRVPGEAPSNRVSITSVLPTQSPFCGITSAILRPSRTVSHSGFCGSGSVEWPLPAIGSTGAWRGLGLSQAASASNETARMAMARLFKAKLSLGRLAPV